MRTMKPADAEMHDADGNASAIIAGARDRARQLVEG